MVAFALGAAFGVIFGLYVLWRLGDWGLNQLLYENKTFAIREVEVQTDGVILPDQLRRWAGVRPGGNLLALDLAGVKRNLEYVPFIASASVERVLPGTLRLRVTERRPVAQVNLPRLKPGSGVELLTYRLDAEGCVISPLDPRQRSTPLYQPEENLPLITGVNPHDIQLGRYIESPAVRAALRFIAAFDHSPMMGMTEVARIDVGTPEVLVVTTAHGSEITLGGQNLERQLLRWRAIHETAVQRERIIASLDLAVTNNIPVRWFENSAPLASPPRAPKPLRKDRKNV